MRNVYTSMRSGGFALLLGAATASAGQGPNFGSPHRLAFDADSSRAVPVALAAVDLDRDGIQDLVVGYETESGGTLAIFPGTGAFLQPGRAFPSAHEVLAPANRRVALPIAPHHLAAGDFDADGAPDLVAAARGGTELHWLRGDGRGGLEPIERSALDGAVTALRADDVNRPDGLPELLVAVDHREGAELLVLESPAGARGATPERTILPSPATSLAAGRLRGGVEVDVAALCGATIVHVEGRDRRLSAGGRRTADRPSVRIQELPAPGVLLESGRFLAAAPGLETLAVVGAGGHICVLGGAEDVPALHAPARVALRARLNGPAVDDLLTAGTVLTSGGREVGVTPAGPIVAAVSMRLNADPIDDLVLVAEGTDDPWVVLSGPLATYTVNSPLDLDDGTCNRSNCTLREAIKRANSSAGADAIDFDLGTGTPKIALLSKLPDVTDAVTILGDTGGATRIEVSGPDLWPSFVVSASSTLRSLLFNRQFVSVRSANSRVEGCWIGLDPTGTAFVDGGGIDFIGATAIGNTLGGTSVAQRNVIATGVSLSQGSGNSILGNYIGWNAAGTQLLSPALVSLDVGATGTVIGGSVTSPGSPPGNVLGSLKVLGGSDGTLIQGNLLGVNPAGTQAAGFPLDGIDIAGSASCTVGGTSAAFRNVVSGFGGFGIGAGGIGGDHPRIQGNFVGLDASGTSAIPNGSSGIIVGTSAADKLVGAATAAPGTGGGNVVAGNLGSGIEASGYPTDPPESATIKGNLVGTDASGTVAIGNAGAGILTYAVRDATIGGPAPEDRNVVAGNGLAEIRVYSTYGTVVAAGNYVGTAVDGTTSLGRPGTEGIFVDSGRDGSTVRVGGAAAAPGVAPGNVVAGCGGHGVHVKGVGSTGVVAIEANLIGLDAAGSQARPNLGDGVHLEGTRIVAVGGADASRRNVIASNIGNGVRVSATIYPPWGNRVEGNFIGTDRTGLLRRGNGGRGILVEAGSNFTIGGPATGPGAAPGNVIAANGREGVWLEGTAQNTSIQGNLIGLASDGIAPLGNGRAGIQIFTRSNLNVVGSDAGLTTGACSGPCNRIAHNALAGVCVFVTGTGAPTNNAAVLGNAVGPNGGLGIDLGADGLTANDPGGDVDVGPNRLLNSPEITAASFDGALTHVQGRLDAEPSISARIDLYRSGGAWVGTTFCSTDASGIGTWTLSVPGVSPALAATTTYAGATSEYGAAWLDLDSDGSPDAEDLDDDADGIPDTVDVCPEAADAAQPDADLDGRGDACDCAPSDGTATRTVGEIVGVRWTDDLTLTWMSAAPTSGTGTVHDVVRGALSGLPSGGPSETCLGATTSAFVVDATVPSPGAGSYYLVRGRNPCGVGTWGFDGTARPREIVACP